MAIVNFYNTYGYYYSSSNSRVEAESHYYASKNRKWLMYMYPAQTSLIKGKVKKATVRMYNQQNYNSTFKFYAVASKSAAVGTAFTEGNYFGKTATQSCVLHPQWSEYNFDVTTCFQYAQENWPGEQWYLWFYWTAGSSDGTALIGYNNTSYADYRCPYFTIETEDSGSYIPDENGKPTLLNSYVWKTSNPTVYYYPETAMTSNSSAGCTTTASSTYNANYPAWQTFNKDYSGNCWASTAADTERWIQITIPKPLYNIKIRIINPTGTNGPISGIIYGSNNGGSSLTQIGSFSGRSATAGSHSLITCNNTNTAYNTIRVKCTEAGAISLNNVAIGELLIIGTDVGTTNGTWVKAEALVWKTSNAKTYTYPAAGMTNWTSQGCIACASTELNNSYPAWKAFNRATGTGDIWFSSDSPTPHWLQLTMPRPLYNIKVQIYNRFGNDHKGAIDGIIYGSNDNGATLTQIGSFSERDPTYGTNSTVTCNNTTKAYNTVRLHITKWGDANGNPRNTNAMGVGAMFVTGTDIGTNGGWANIKDNTCPEILLYPKSMMTSAMSKDCIVTASTQFSADYQPFYAFNKNVTGVWCTTNTDTSPWLQIVLPEPLYNISIILFNRVNTNYGPGGFIDFTIQGSKDNGTLKQIYSATGRNGATSGSSSTHTIGNKTSYDTLKFIPSNWTGKGSTYCGMGEIFIFGTKQP